MGLVNESYRLPLCPMAPKLRRQLAECLKEIDVI